MDRAVYSAADTRWVSDGSGPGRLCLVLGLRRTLVRGVSA